MKRIVLSVIIISVVLLFVGCHYKGVRFYDYYIGEEIQFSNGSAKLDIDIDNERFIYYRNVDSDKQWGSFSFGFRDHLTGKDYTHNPTQVDDVRTFDYSKEFEITDKDGNKIVFTDLDSTSSGIYGYEYYGSNVFYISYKNANTEIKEAIEKDRYCISAGGFRFISENYWNAMPSENVE